MTNKRSTIKKNNDALQTSVSKTKLEATILLKEPTNGKVLSPEDIIQDLNEKGIIFGIDRDKIKEMVQGSMYNQDIVIARGKPPINGDDAKVVYIFSDESDVSIPGTIGENGRIDYKTLNKIRNVRTGDLLIEIVPPTQGISGTDVYGNEIVAKKGNPVIIRKGKNVKEGKNGLKIYATRDGEVCFKDNTIYVNEVITIDGDIDNETGNIQFNGKVNIRGNVKSGFRVEADGDIEIFGVVEGATLISGGDIVVHRGIQGNGQAYLCSSGNFKSKYIENACIKSAGDVEADVILHSDITAQSGIIASGRKGLIVGGNIKAGKKVRAKVLGSNMGTSTVIEVGIDPGERDNYEQLKKEIEGVRKSIEDSKKAIDLLNKMAKQQQLAKDKEEILAKLLITHETLKKKYRTLTEEIQVLLKKFQNCRGGKIYASAVIYPGVRAVIGNSVRQIYDELHNSTLYVKDGEVTVGPYEK